MELTDARIQIIKQIAGRYLPIDKVISHCEETGIAFLDVPKQPLSSEITAAVVVQAVIDAHDDRWDKVEDIIFNAQDHLMACFRSAKDYNDEQRLAAERANRAKLGLIEKLTVAEFIERLAPYAVGKHACDARYASDATGLAFTPKQYKDDPESALFMTEVATMDPEESAGLTGKYYVCLNRSEWDGSKEECARALYQWCVDEGLIDGEDLGIKIW